MPVMFVTQVEKQLGMEFSASPRGGVNTFRRASIASSSPPPPPFYWIRKVHVWRAEPWQTPLCAPFGP
jgi:hypothetical protein